MSRRSSALSILSRSFIDENEDAEAHHEAEAVGGGDEILPIDFGGFGLTVGPRRRRGPGARLRFSISSMRSL